MLDDELENKKRKASAVENDSELNKFDNGNLEKENVLKHSDV